MTLLGTILVSESIMQLDNKVALVTGSGRGIGRAIALEYARAGAKVVVNYGRNRDQAETAVSEIRDLGGEAVAIQADISRLDQIRKLFNEALKAFGQLDILVNNAGVEKNAPFWEVTEEDYDRVMDTNLKGSFFCSQLHARHLLKNKLPGKIINISSVHEDLPFPNFASYCASKGGLRMLTRDLAIELGPFGITVNSIAPGAIKTNINSKLLENKKQFNALVQYVPLKRLGEPYDVAKLALFLASSDSDYVTGATLFVDGGLTWQYQEQ
jgi:glucose 1-dehydrogenase